MPASVPTASGDGRFKSCRTGDVKACRPFCTAPLTMKPLLLCLPLLLLLVACEQLGIPDPAKDAAAKEADGRAIGAACRHAGRALEDCYTLNPGGHKAAIFAGWRDMNDYMAENKIEVVKPDLPTLGTLPKARPRAAEADEEAPAEASASDNAKPRTSTRRSRRSSSAAAATAEN